MLVGVWAHVELEKAAHLSYKVARLIEVWHYKWWMDDLFTRYVDTFLRLKQQADGWPAWCEMDADKDVYIYWYEENEGYNSYKMIFSAIPACTCWRSFV